MILEDPWVIVDPAEPRNPTGKYVVAKRSELKAAMSEDRRIRPHSEHRKSSEASAEIDRLEASGQ